MITMLFASVLATLSVDIRHSVSSNASRSLMISAIAMKHSELNQNYNADLHGSKVSGCSLIWEFDFHKSIFTLRSVAKPNTGAWMPNDETWQNPAQGYEDFAATTCSPEDIASKVCNIAGGTFVINPNDPKTTKFNPFSLHNGYLTISAIRTPKSLYSTIREELAEQGVPGPVPSYVGGRLLTNPNVFPGFTYGYFEFSVAFPNAGPGMFPALWFYSTPGTGANPGKAHAEIDLLEFFGHSDVFYTHIIQGNSGDANASKVSEQVGQWPGSIDGIFHKYGMDWTADHIDFYFDHHLMYSASKSAVVWFRGVSLSPVVDYVVDAPSMTSNPKIQANSSTPKALKMNVSRVRL